MERKGAVMKATFAAAVIAVAVPILGLAGAASAQPAGSPGCPLPSPQRSYDDSQLHYQMGVDLSGCDWWDGSPIQLEATLERIDPAGGEGATRIVRCATPLIAADAGDDPQPDVSSPRSGRCDVAVTVDHPPVDWAHYHGEITFPWRGGQRTVSFDAACSAATGCVDVPFDPTGPLAPVGDLVGGAAPRDSHAA
jgi:hypothetical protein